MSIATLKTKVVCSKLNQKNLLSAKKICLNIIRILVDVKLLLLNIKKSKHLKYAIIHGLPQNRFRCCY